MSDDHKTPPRTGCVTTLWGIFPQLDQHLRRALLEAGYGDIMDENFEPPHDPLVQAKLFDGCEASVCWVRASRLAARATASSIADLLAWSTSSPWPAPTALSCVC
jgi:hypothetical protein